MNHSEQDFKDLRKSIVALSIVKHGWQPEDLHEVMTEWGYGNSLRALVWEQLHFLKRDLLAIKTHNETFDNQGMKMWSLAKRVWPQRTKQRLQRYMVKKYHKIHWNPLDEAERRGTMNMLRGYLKRNKDKVNTGG
jgi:hypothetical protein